jgi:MtrB/PioB family decaheme-associated outer membrane protein
MKNSQGRFARRGSATAIAGAVLAIAAASAAQAAEVDPAVSALTKPTNTIEAGVGYVTDSSFKFGQYNGLFNKGPYGIFNLDLRGGDGYNNDSDSAVRWRVDGTDLGLDTRTLYAEYGEQGKFRVFGGFDELRSNYSDSFQTPFLGVGSNRLTLPGNWVKPIVPQVSTSAGNFRGLSPTTGLANSLVNGVSTPPTAAQQAIVNNIIANDVPDFQNADLDTVRKTYLEGFSYNLTSRWQFLFSATQTNQDGLKQLGMLSLSSGTVSTINPLPIDQNTNQYNASLTYTGEDFFFTGAYYGSYFINHVSSMTWENPFAPGTFATMSTAPSNQFNQFTLKGGYNFSPTTKLVMGASYARNTQDDPFLADPGNSPLGLPVSSLNGLVVSTQFNAKLTARPAKGLNVAVGYKYNDRDNRTPVNTYEFYDAGEPPAATPSPFNAALGLAPGTLASNINIYANRPYSKKSNQFNADADYVVTKGQSIKGGYEWQEIDRSCPGSWINCADAPTATTNTLHVAWDANSIENVTGRLSYAYSQRRVTYDQNAWLALVPMANFIPTGATQSVVDFLHQTGLGGFGPVAPYVPLQPGNLGIFFPNNSSLVQTFYGSRNDIHEILGMQRFNMADRNQNKVRGTLNWDVTETLSLTGNVEFNDDNYSNSVFGLQKAQNLAATVEGTWAASENFSMTAFYTYEQQKTNTAGASYSSGQITNTATVGGVAGNTVVSGGCFATVMDKNTNAKIDPCLNWGTNMVDNVSTVGLGFKYNGLMAGRLDLLGDLLYSAARTSNDMNGGTYANSPFAVSGRPVVTPAAFFIPAANLPNVNSNLFELKIAGRYALDKTSALRLFYWYQRLSNTDYAYDGVQYGTITSVMPTNQQAPNYNVSVFGISYMYRF